MPTNLSVSGNSPVAATAIPPPPPAAVAPAATVKTPTYPNPSYRLDSALGIVVMEFRSAGGDVRSLPTRQQLDAYMRSLESGATPDFAGAATV